MYEIGLKRHFIARHFIPGGPPGEREPHSHDYMVEARLKGASLDEKGYVFDIVELKHAMQSSLEKYHDQFLNNLPELKGVYPSMENLARVLCNDIRGRIKPGNLKSMEIKIWESPTAWAAFRIENSALES
jgi:6-pyruvoyltetrahydropterin/6-carboxytetrahydropterin synthase